MVYHEVLSNSINYILIFCFQSIIFYAIRSAKLEDWLASQSILKALQPMHDRNFVDLDPIFNVNIDEDFDIGVCGITRNMYYQIYGEWISYCAERWEKDIDTTISSSLVLLCFALSLLGNILISLILFITLDE